MTLAKDKKTINIKLTNNEVHALENGEASEGGMKEYLNFAGRRRRLLFRF